MSDRPALGQGEAREKRAAAAAAGAESASGPVPPPLLRGRPYPGVTLLPPTFANTLPLQQLCLSPFVLCLSMYLSPSSTFFSPPPILVEL